MTGHRRMRACRAGLTLGAHDRDSRNDPRIRALHRVARRRDALGDRRRARGARIQRRCRRRLRRCAGSRPRPHPRWLLGDDQHLRHAAGDRHRGRDRRRRTVRLGAQQDDRTRLRDPAAGDEGDRRPARLRARQRPRDHPRRDAGHRLGLRQPARLLRLGRRQRHLRRRRPEARPHAGSRARRIYEHSLKLEDARAYAAYGQNSLVGKILEIHQEPPGRIHVVLIRQSVGF